MIVLIGFMGAGKSTVGRLIAQRLRMPFLDSDHVIEERTGRAVRDIFAQDGEPAFRDIEHATILSLLQGPDVVLALGGGAAEDPRTRAALTGVDVVYLQVGYEKALGRVRGDALRPLLARPDLNALYQRRLPVYEELATLIVATDERPAGRIAADVLERLASAP